MCYFEKGNVCVTSTNELKWLFLFKRHVKNNLFLLFVFLNYATTQLFLFNMTHKEFPSFFFKFKSCSTFIYFFNVRWLSNLFKYVSSACIKHKIEYLKYMLLKKNSYFKWWVKKIFLIINCYLWKINERGIPNLDIYLLP